MALQLCYTKEEVDKQDQTTVHLLRIDTGHELVCGEDVCMDAINDNYITKMTLYESEVTCKSCLEKKDNN